MREEKHPALLHLFSTVHFFERFSYYGIRSLLLLYLVTELDFTDHKSYTIIGVYSTLTYITPLLGGYISDRYIGISKALWSGLFFMLLGYICLFFLENRVGFFIGLGLVATGSGLYKPNMNALIGRLYSKDHPQKGPAYTIFYVYQNAGSFLAPLICGGIGLTAGWNSGFAITCFSIMMGLLVLYYSQRLKEEASPSPPPLKISKKESLFLISGALCLSVLLASVVYWGEETLNILLGLSLVYGAVFWKHYRACNASEKKDMLLIFFGVMAVALSGALIGHGETVFTLFMSRNIDAMFFTFQVPVTFIQSIDPLTIILLGSITSFWWKRMNQKKQGTSEKLSKKSHFSDVGKIMVGFGFIVIAYAYLYLLCQFFHSNHLISLVSFAAGLVILSASDIFIYPNVLTFCSKRAPQSLATTVMGFVVFGMALSQLFGTYLARLSSVQEPLVNGNIVESWAAYTDFFFAMTGLSLGVFAVLLCCVWWISKKQNGSEQA